MSELDRELEELGADITTGLEELPVPAVLVDADGVVRWQNAAGKAFRGDLTGANFTEFLAPEQLAQAQQVFTEILCRGEPAEFTLKLTDASGAVVPAEISSVPLRREGSIVGVFGLTVRIADSRAGPAAGAAGEDILTPRQLEVLRLLGRGASTHEIASMLHLSTTTVRNHIANILVALGADTRLQAVLNAQAKGLLEP